MTYRQLYSQWDDIFVCILQIIKNNISINERNMERSRLCCRNNVISSSIPNNREICIICFCLFIMSSNEKKSRENNFEIIFVSKLR